MISDLGGCYNAIYPELEFLPIALASLWSWMMMMMMMMMMIMVHHCS
jgi:hypothetical protein